MNLPIEKIATDILKNYNGQNDFILNLKKRLKSSSSFAITRVQAEYILKNKNVEPITINKVVYIYKSCIEYVKNQLFWEIENNEIFVNKILSRNEDILHILVSDINNPNKSEMIHVSKRCFKKINEVGELNFDGYDRQPKPHQIEAIKKLLQHNKFILGDDMGLGKMELVDNQVFTPYGRKKIGDLIVGDSIIGSNGKPCKVTGVFPHGVQNLFKITFNDGYSIKCGGKHLWTVSSRNSGENSKNRTNRYVTISTEQMLDENLYLEQKGVGFNKNKSYTFKTFYKQKNGDSKWQIPIVKPIHFSNNYKLILEPYLLGLILGDGHVLKKSVNFTLHKDDFDELLSGYNIKESYSPKENLRICRLSLNNELIELGLVDKKSDAKFIPNQYKYSSIQDRLAILQGLMDTGGHCLKNKKNGVFYGTQYYTVSEKLADDVAEIVHSLGGIVRKKSKIGSYKKPDGTKVICKKCFVLNIKLPEGMNPFRLKRKASLYNEPKKYRLGRYIKNIEPCGQGEAVCISVDAEDKLYVTEHAIVTHNTSSSILAAIKGDFKKILVVCPASLKLNWKKEISFYNSPEDVSIVDGVDFRVKKWTIVNYDILKNFHDLPQKGVKKDPENLSPIDFHKFDLVIADEAHRLKNSTSNTSKIFMDFAKNIPNIWLLTGTPITNRPMDFYNLLKLCDAPITDNWVFYARRYCAAKQFNRKGTTQKYWVTSGASNLDELRDFSSEFILRRTKKDSIDLPPKTIIPIYLPVHLCHNYNTYLKEYEDWVEEMEAIGEKPTVTDHLTKLIKIRQLLSNDKISHTISMAEDYIEEGHKVVIFSCFTSTINTIHEHFGKSSVIVDGSVSKEKRQLAVDKFQTDAKIKVFCGNIIAAGVGLTLTEGTIAIFNDLDWTPANHAQAEDRIYRIGQVNDVNILYPLFDETLDTIMFETLRRKMEIISKVIGDDSVESDISVGKEVINSLKN